MATLFFDFDSGYKILKMSHFGCIHLYRNLHVGIPNANKEQNKRNNRHYYDSRMTVSSAILFVHLAAFAIQAPPCLAANKHYDAPSPARLGDKVEEKRSPEMRPQSLKLRNPSDTDIVFVKFHQVSTMSMLDKVSADDCWILLTSDF